MKDEETGLEIYGIPNTETRASIIAGLEKGTIRVFAVSCMDGKKVVYSTMEEAMQNCGNDGSVEELDIMFDFKPVHSFHTPEQQGEAK